MEYCKSPFGMKVVCLNAVLVGSKCFGATSGATVQPPVLSIWWDYQDPTELSDRRPGGSILREIRGNCSQRRGLPGGVKIPLGGGLGPVRYLGVGTRTQGPRFRKPGGHRVAKFGDPVGNRVAKERMSRPRADRGTHPRAPGGKFTRIFTPPPVEYQG